MQIYHTHTHMLFVTFSAFTKKLHFLSQENNIYSPDKTIIYILLLLLLLLNGRNLIIHYI